MFPEPGRDYHLRNAETVASLRSQVPDREVRMALRAGCFAKVMLDVDQGPSEKFWVLIDKVTPGISPSYEGTIDNDLVFPWIWELDCGDRVEFGPEHVLAIMWPVEAEVSLPLAAG